MEKKVYLLLDLCIRVTQESMMRGWLLKIFFKSFTPPSLPAKDLNHFLHLITLHGLKLIISLPQKCVNKLRGRGGREQLTLPYFIDQWHPGIFLLPLWKTNAAKAQVSWNSAAENLDICAWDLISCRSSPLLCFHFPTPPISPLLLFSIFTYRDAGSIPHCG